MDATGITLQVLPEYQLKLSFPNGSQAIIDMKHRVRALEDFHRRNCLKRRVWKTVKWSGTTGPTACGLPSTNCWIPCR